MLHWNKLVCGCDVPFQPLYLILPPYNANIIPFAHGSQLPRPTSHVVSNF